MGDYTIKLFYADWCGHCVRFKPEWEKFKKLVNNNTLKDKRNNDINIRTEEFQDGSNQMEFEKENVMAFPTLIIYKGENNREVFDKRPTFETLVEHFNIRNDNQSGGDLNDYAYKYRKYKHKYLMNKYK